MYKKKLLQSFIDFFFQYKKPNCLCLVDIIYELIYKFYEDKYNIIGQVHALIQQKKYSNCKIMHDIIKTCTRREYEFV